jgi:hypothetical protein
MSHLRRLALAFAAVFVAGCASLEAPSGPRAGCVEWYAQLDRAVDEAGVRDAQQARIDGFPYLRVDRTLAALRTRASGSPAAFEAYVERLGALDLEARAHEIRNLRRPPTNRAEVLQRTRDCARLLRELDRAAAPARAALLERAQVPDEYSTVARAFGLYPLTRFAFIAGIRRWEEQSLASFRRDRDSNETLVRYAPPAGEALGRREVAGLLATAKLDRLGQPTLSERELVALTALYAPSFEISVAADYDRFGELRWRRGAHLPEVDAAELAVYVHPAYTRYGETVLLQLVYTIWFPERPARGAVDFLAGRLDGVTWRVTLAPDGDPLLYDSIHPCGCYHVFFPTPRARPRPAPDPLEEWAFVPHSLPRVAEGERPVVKLASATHYIEGVELVRGADSLTRYVFHPYDELRSLPSLDGGHRSVFGPDGRVAGTERLERWFFWPMGVPSAGAMRQWGRHATAFVGRRHFDDPDLVERRFELDLGARP